MINYLREGKKNKQLYVYKKHRIIRLKTDSPQIGHENKSTAILPLPLIQEEQLSVTGERMCTKYW